MNKVFYSFFFLLILIASGCTQSTTQRQSANDLETAQALNLTIMVTDNL